MSASPRLYHWEPNAASARALICLREKGVPFVSCYVDVLAFEQWEPEFLHLNPSAQVPVLVHDGAALSQASYISEYVDEAFSGPRLMPEDAYGRWRARAWQKFVDDGLAASVSELAWEAYGMSVVATCGGGALPLRLGSTTPIERGDAWRAAVTGLDADQLARARARVGDAVIRVEAHLAHAAWLAGPSYSLADVAVFSYLNYLPELCADLLNVSVAPSTMAWLEAVAARPAVRSALAISRSGAPYRCAAPGPEQVRWG
jgi:glutathione S-transferase/GST-like protein